MQCNGNFLLGAAAASQRLALTEVTPTTDKVIKVYPERNLFIANVKGSARAAAAVTRKFSECMQCSGGGKRLRRRKKEERGQRTNERLPFFALFASVQIGRRTDGGRSQITPYGPIFAAHEVGHVMLI